jgi:hypothetical protein
MYRIFLILFSKQCSITTIYIQFALHYIIRNLAVI